MQLVSSGGTAATLREAGIEVTEVADVTGFPEMLGGRVKTLHPAIHGGLLADQRDPDHLAQIAAQGIEPFDLLGEQPVPVPRDGRGRARASRTRSRRSTSAGPAMVRAGAKNFESVGVVVNPDRYETVLEESQLEGGLTRATRFALAAEAFAHTAAYDAAVGGWFAQQQADGDALPGVRRARLREGRGPALRREPAPARRAVRRRRRARVSSAVPRCCRARRCRSTTGSMRGRPTTWRSRCPSDACVIVKHNNPCGVAALERRRRLLPRRVRVRRGQRVRRDRRVPRRRATRRRPRRCARCSPRS